MGIRATWIGVRGVDKAVVFEALGLKDTGKNADPDSLDQAYWEQPAGWLVVQLEEVRYPPVELLERLSESGQVVFCSISETVMYSSVFGYQHGRAEWSIVCEPDRSRACDPEITGEPPLEFAPIRDRLVAKQNAAGDAGVDFVFGVATELTYALCGFRNDGEPMPGGDPVMTLLEGSAPDPSWPRRRRQGPGFWTRLMGAFDRKTG